MRRALLTDWPALTAIYGLHPWHIELLTVDELYQYQLQAEQIAKALGR